jgi:hypothetical protein
VRTKNPMIKTGIYLGLRKIRGDIIITALPLKPDTAFPKSLAGSADETVRIGDCREPNLIIDPVADGVRTTLRI